jgi:hypothetical protein
VCKAVYIWGIERSGKWTVLDIIMSCCKILRHHSTPFSIILCHITLCYTIQEAKIVWAKDWINSQTQSSPNRRAVGGKDLSVNCGRTLVLEALKEAVIQVGELCGRTPLEERFQLSPYIQIG